MVLEFLYSASNQVMGVLMENARAHADLSPEALFSLVLKKC